MGKSNWEDKQIRYYHNLYLDLKADYDRMRTLWLADIKRNADQYYEIIALKNKCDYKDRCTESQYQEILRLNKLLTAAKTTRPRVHTMGQPADPWARNEIQTGMIVDLQKENKTLEEENGNLGRRIIELSRKLTAADDLAVSLKTQLSYYTPLWYTETPVKNY